MFPADALTVTMAGVAGAIAFEYVAPPLVESASMTGMTVPLVTPCTETTWVDGVPAVPAMMPLETVTESEKCHI